MPRSTLPVWIFQPFTDQLALNVISDLLFYENVFGEEAIQRANEDVQPKVPFKVEDYPIKMYINSPGGFVTDLMAVIDTMDGIEKDVETICLGEAASAAAVVLSNGEKGKRWIGKNSHVLIHQVSSLAFGHIKDVEIAVRQAKVLNDQIIKILARNTGKSASQVREDMDRDLWLNAKQAVEYGIVDQILADDSNEVKELNAQMNSKMKVFSIGGDIQKKLSEAPLEKKSVHFEIKKSREEGDFFIFEGYASVFDNTDDDDDVVHHGAFRRTLKTSKLLDNPQDRTMLWQHDTHQPIGIATLTEDDHGLKFTGTLPKEDHFVSGRVIPQLKIGSIRTMSFGFKVGEKYYKDGKRHITDMELYEISPVTIPANSEARILAMKKATRFTDLPLAPDDMVWDSTEARKHVREFTGSEDKPSADFKKAFFWFDQDNEDLFGSFKLPFVDVVDGMLKAVPRGIQAAAGAMRGSRGGVDIPEEDRPAVIRHMNRYFNKMDKDSPFDEDKSLCSPTISDINKFLKTKGLSKSERDKVIYDLKKAYSKPWDEEEEGAPRDEDEEGKRIKTEFLDELKHTIKSLGD